MSTEKMLAETALARIATYPIHSEPIGGAYAMRDFAENALWQLNPKQSNPNAAVQQVAPKGRWT